MTEKKPTKRTRGKQEKVTNKQNNGDDHEVDSRLDASKENKEIRDNGKEYEVGYKKPPKNKQYKSGQSGNPNGRPKGSKNFQTLFKQELAIKVVVQEQGERKTLSKQEIMVKRAVNQALEGNPNAQRIILSIIGTDPEIDPNKPLEQNHLDILEKLQERLTAQSELDETPNTPDTLDDKK